MPVVMRLRGWADGRECHEAGKFIRTVNIQKSPTDAWVTITSELDKAQQWTTHQDALATYYETLLIQPITQDGRPNRPLTALLVIIEELTEEEAPA